MKSTTCLFRPSLLMRAIVFIGFIAFSQNVSAHILRIETTKPQEVKVYGDSGSFLGFDVTYQDDIVSEWIPNFVVMGVSNSTTLTQGPERIDCLSDNPDNSITGNVTSAIVSDLNPKMLHVDLASFAGTGRLTICPDTAESVAEYNEYISIDTEVPFVTNVTSSNPDTVYGVGDTLFFSVQFSEAVSLSPGFNATLDLAVGDNMGLATLVATSDTVVNELQFSYTVLPGDVSPDLQYEGPSSLSVISGAVIKPSTGVPALLALPDVAPTALHSLAGNKNIVIATLDSEPVIPVSSNGSSGGGFDPSFAFTPSHLTANMSHAVGPSVSKYCPAINGYWNISDFGDEVKKIQLFLNIYEQQKLVVDGNYDEKTLEAVKAFQIKYSEQVLSPWGLTSAEATGHWYKTTSKLANYLLGCDTGEVLLSNGITLTQYTNPPKLYETLISKPFLELITEKYLTL